MGHFALDLKLVCNSLNNSFASDEKDEFINWPVYALYIFVWYRLHDFPVNNLEMI